MKYIAIASVASLALLAACSQGGDSAKQNAAEAVNATQDATSGVVGQTSAATVGANTVGGFVTGLATGNLYELEAAKVAAAKSTSADVKALAAMITKDHTAAGQKLAEVAPTAAPDVTIPTALDARRQGLIDNLNAATPGDFNKVYLDQQIAAHNETLTLLNGFEGNTDAPALSALARELIPTVTAHRDRAQTLRDAIRQGRRNVLVEKAVQKWAVFFVADERRLPFQTIPPTSRGHFATRVRRASGRHPDTHHSEGHLTFNPPRHV